MEFANQLGDKKTVSLCVCNLGVLEGNRAYQLLSDKNKFDKDMYPIRHFYLAYEDDLLKK